MTALARLRAQAEADIAVRDTLALFVSLLESDTLEGAALYDALEAAVAQARGVLNGISLSDGGLAQGNPKVRLQPGEQVIPLDSVNISVARKVHLSDLAPPTPIGLHLPCATCGRETPADEFPRMGKGTSKSCRDCVSERTREQLARMREKKAALEAAAKMPPVEELRACTRCTSNKPITDFSVDDDGDRGHVCTACRAADREPTDKEPA